MTGISMFIMLHSSDDVGGGGLGARAAAVAGARLDGGGHDELLLRLHPAGIPAHPVHDLRA